MELLNETIVITGASKGLGKEIAVYLGQKYSNIILVARSGDLLNQVQKEISKSTGRNPMVIVCDISNENEVNKMAAHIREKYKCIDVLINNAGIAVHKPSEKMTNDEMRKQFEVNYFGAFYCYKSLLPLIKQSASGYILNVSSLVSKISFADNSVYASTKFALSGFSEGLRQEMKKYNIKVGLFLPGIMDTDFHKDREADIHKTPAFLFLNLNKAVKKIDKMILKRKKKVYMYKWMLMLMKVKRLFD
jgi:uncharacterized protein